MIRTPISRAGSVPLKRSRYLRGMDAAHPGPGEEPNYGTPTAPRLAATVILLRDAGDGFEVLLVKRNPRARFMGGAWVFPGGALHPEDGEGDAGLRVAAVREVAE